MFKYISTRDPQLKVIPRKAILDGLAPDGGLFIPEIPVKSDFEPKSLIHMDYLQLAKPILHAYFPDLPEAILQNAVLAAYHDKFSDPLITPLKTVGAYYVLELFHGPTGAFKDIALALLPQLMAAAKPSDRPDQLILTATSGDTGSAALDGFARVPHTRIIAFYPDAGISLIQRRQMTTNNAPNVTACGVRANFDAIQSAVKQIFHDLTDQAALSSANSINIGRLIPQIVYYFAAYRQLLEQHRITFNEAIDFVVPTGNFGDILAGYLAKQLGLPIHHLICAVNENDVLYDFFTTGHYDKRRPFQQTIAPSMDILVSSNLERLLYLKCGAKATASYMRQLDEQGHYQISAAELAAIRQDFRAHHCTDRQAKTVIKAVYEQNHYLLDPHTAMAWQAAKHNHDGRKQVILATATPYKFSETVYAALTGTPLEDGFAALQALHQLTGLTVPASLRRLAHQPIVQTDVITVDEMYGYVLRKLNH